ncbi:response regulator [Pyxidicoccus sp. MSG2]|uniref:response regulator n=1 Tax=Pyxidicoccus sp. MSG2 TaxID=2996790 RepID=UPI0022709AF9|nr:response regulator [Pyxidicoccus sp. MSG2]MCY1019746.1 response regulator [Pyxidicoccus sp. MSG2]
MSTILLVDDEAEVLEVYSEVLELMGHDVVRASDGQQALELAHQRRPDLVVTDWMMPRMNGVMLCSALAQAPEFQGLPIIMHSSSGNPRAPGVQRFLPKTGRLDDFAEGVTRTLTEAQRPRPTAVPTWTGPRAPPRPTPDSRRGSRASRERGPAQSAARTAASAAS